MSLSMVRNAMKFLFFIIFIASLKVEAQVKICSWNVSNLGKSKPDSILRYMAKQLESCDIIALQEIVTSQHGELALRKLTAYLDEDRKVWNYVISPATSTYENQQQREKYAFLWRKDKSRLKGNAWLDSCYQYQIEREPFMANFSMGKEEFTLVNFHALPKQKNPEKEIKYLKFFQQNYSIFPLVILGDFNLPQIHNVFNALKYKDYAAALLEQATTLKMQCEMNNCLANPLDNIFYPNLIFKQFKSGIIPFYLDFKFDMKAARKVSDHVPIFVILQSI